MSDRFIIEECERRAFAPKTGAERLDALRVVVSSREPARIDGVSIEHHWARMILQLHDALGPAEQTRLAETPMSRIPDLIGELAGAGGSRGPLS